MGRSGPPSDVLLDSEAGSIADEVPDLAVRRPRTTPRARMQAISARRSVAVMVSGLRVESTARSGIKVWGVGVRHSHSCLEFSMPSAGPMRAFFTRSCRRFMSVATVLRSQPPRLRSVSRDNPLITPAAVSERLGETFGEIGRASGRTDAAGLWWRRRRDSARSIGRRQTLANTGVERANAAEVSRRRSS